MKIIEENPTGFDVECSCGHTIFALRGYGVVECVKCGRVRDPRRLLYKWVRHDDPAERDYIQA